MSRAECEAFVQRVLDLYVVNPDVEQIWRRMDTLYKITGQGKTRDTGHLFVVGEPGVGKSELLKKFVERHSGHEFQYEDGTVADVKPVVYVECPYPFTEKRLYIKITTALGAPILNADPTVGRARAQMEQLIKMQQVRLIILDELNFLVETRRMNDHIGMEHLKSLTSEGIGLVCAGTSKIDNLRLLDEQYKSRFARIALNRLSKGDAFRDFLIKVEEQLDPPYPIGLGKIEQLTDKIYEWTQGNLRKFHWLLREAYAMLGIFDDDFEDISRAKMTVDVLKAAHDRLIG